MHAGSDRAPASHAPSRAARTSSTLINRHGSGPDGEAVTLGLGPVPGDADGDGDGAGLGVATGAGDALGLGGWLADAAAVAEAVVEAVGGAV